MRQQVAAQEQIKRGNAILTLIFARHSDRYRVSPLVAGSGDDVLPPGEIEAAHRAIAEALVATSGIDVDQIDNILVHGRAGAAAWPLTAIAQLVVTAERETLAKVAPFAPLLRAADTSRPLLPTNPHLGLMLRLAQTCLTAARGFGPEAGRAARARVRFNLVHAMVGDSANEGLPTMAATKLSDEALLAFFQSHPKLRERLSSIVGAVGNADGTLGEADAAEERLVEEMRLLGRQAMRSWADERVVATEQEVRLQPGMRRQGKKTPVAHEIRRDHGLRAAIPVR